jgi:beta-glucosidase-like glycosyl hydrolase/CubicO group peptidase (beta-lactamase class C family)
MVRMARNVVIFLFVLVTSSLFAPPIEEQELITSNSWVQTTFDSLTVDERIAQLFMIEVRPTYGSKHLYNVEQTIKKHQVGGVVFFKGNPTQQVELTNKFQQLSKTKMLVAIDGEWGLAMRLSNTIAYPYQLGLGGIQNNEIIYEMGKEVGRQCKRLGIHVNFAPVIDINNNPNNPVINYRSFGEDPKNVCNKGWAYAKGMQEAGIIACAKHFPGHGDTDVDSHKDLPVINHSMERLRSVEFVPFKHLIEQGVMSVMTAHLSIPAIDNRPNIAVSISDKAINGILRREMGFTGLSFTDALNMQGVAKYHPDGELELMALTAGNDILLSPGDIPKATNLIKNAMASGKLSKDYVWGKVKKILNYKHAVGLHNWEEIDERNVEKDLNSTQAKHVYYDLVEQELCLAKDNKQLVPVDQNKQQKILSIAIGKGNKTKFQYELEKIGNVTSRSISKNASALEFDKLKSLSTGYDLTIISVHATSKYPPNYGITNQSAAFISKLGAQDDVVFVDFGNPYNLKKFKNQNTVLLAYENLDAHQVKAAKAVFGVIGMSGTLAVTVGSEFPVGSGITTQPISEFNKALPEEVGMSSQRLKKVDGIARKAIRIGATPGCQVFIAKNGKVVYNKSFGKHTSNSSQKVKNEDLYDLASITKVAATTITLMKLDEEGLIDINEKMSVYLSELEGTNKANMTIKQVLEHKAGLKSWIPFYYATISDDNIYDSIYSSTFTDIHTVDVGNSLYILKDYKKNIFSEIYNSELKNIGKYKYSDLGMILMKELIERVTGTPFEKYVNGAFYEPMNIDKLTFLPLQKFDKEDLIPTSLSPDMRKGLVHGNVHDPAAAMLGGVSGHAGLFGNAESLAKLMQMLLDGGEFGNTRYLESSTIDKFTKRQAGDSRRGIGWDKPEMNRKRINPASDYASSLCFGHTGFTGTMVWVDPKHDLVYVFLSNRVYPTQENKKLIREGIRTDIMDVIYESFLLP